MAISQLTFLTNDLMSSPVDSRARTSVRPIQHRIQKGCKGVGLAYSLKSSESFASADPVTSYWKTQQRCLISDKGEIWEQFSGSFPSAGMMRSGQLYQRAPWVPHTHGTGCSLWPTPTASMGRSGWPFNKTTTGTYKKSTRDRALAYGPSPPPALAEWLMGFPADWTGLEP